MDPAETVDQRWTRPKQADGAPVPGLVLIFTAGQPRLDAIPLDATPLLVRRGPVGPVVLDDACLSRRHAEVWFARGELHVRDLGSRNGTALDGIAVSGERTAGGARVLRAGDTIFLYSDDLRPVLDHERAAGPHVVGPTLRRTWDEIRRAARGEGSLHVTGETGAGKELAAREFHTAATPGGPFVAVNCATIPQGLAERLLFGAKKGVYSGADADSEGYLQTAHGGTIFLDEIAELDLQVQAKLLRALETGEVMPLGAAKPRAVSVRIVSATHGDLRKRVADGAFREDLYFRIGRPVVAVPALRERREDIPWLVAAALRGKPAHVSLVEAALLRTWPGNVRELLHEIAAAARAAADANAETVEAIHLDEDAGKAFEDEPGDDTAAPARGPDRGAIERALRREAGNVTRAAAELGVHRTQLRRWIATLGLDPKTFAGS